MCTFSIQPGPNGPITEVVDAGSDTVGYLPIQINFTEIKSDLAKPEDSCNQKLLESDLGVSFCF